MMVRQGDILLVQVRARPPDGREVPRERGELVLAHGEATHHRHRVVSRDARLVEYSGGRWLCVGATAQLVHEEHGRIRVPPGTYRVVRQREYAPGARSTWVID